MRWFKIFKPFRYRVFEGSGETYFGAKSIYLGGYHDEGKAIAFGERVIAKEPHLSLYVVDVDEQRTVWARRHS